MSFSHPILVIEEFDMPVPCVTSVDICALRAVRLDDTGAFEYGADAMYEMTEVLQLGVSQEIQEGARTTLPNGCGGICFNRKQDTRILGVTLALELCHLDAELLELMTGGTVLTSGGSPIGFEPRGFNDTPPKVALEVWTKAWDGDEAATIPYIRWAYPLTTWTPGNFTLQNDVLRVPLTGDASPNENFGTGPLGDWPNLGVSEPNAYFHDTDIPSGVCGTQELVAVGS